MFNFLARMQFLEAKIRVAVQILTYNVQSQGKKHNRKENQYQT